jgi:hypothetical protein
VADNGRRICVHRGDQITVALMVDPAQNPYPQQWWSAITVTGRAVKVIPRGILPVRGATLGLFTAVVRGHARLASIRPLCPPSLDAPACHSLRVWSVAIAVR